MQKDLTERLELHVRNLIRWENDQARPRPKALQKLADILEVYVEELEKGGSRAVQLSQDPELAELLEQFLELEPCPARRP